MRASQKFYIEWRGDKKVSYFQIVDRVIQIKI